MNNNNPQWLAATLLSLLLLFSGGCQHRAAEDSEQLTANETRALLKSLPALPEKAKDTQVFQQRPSSPPPPRAGNTVQSPFPPQDRATPTAEGAQAPTLIRFSPLGEVDSASLLSLTFSEPMIAIGAQGETMEDLPIHLKPEVSGRWRWVDTRSLVFEPEAGRFPMATNFKVEVDGDMTSAAGLPLEELEETANWGFSTAPLKLTRMHPSEDDQPVSQQPVLLLVFNQPFDAEALLPWLSLKVQDDNYPLQIANTEAINKDNNRAAERLDKLDTEHWIAVMPSKPLPKGSRAVLSVSARAPALEGPRLTNQKQARTLQIAGPLKVTQARCNWNDDPCLPEQRWSLTFNNPLSDDWSSEQLTIQPELPYAEIWAHGNTLSISGQTKPDTTYHLTLKAGTEDRFGQALREDVTTVSDIGSYPPYLLVSRDPMVVIPGGKTAVLPVLTRNIEQFEVELRRVQPQDWSHFSRYQEQLRRYGVNLPEHVNAVDKPGEFIKRYTQNTAGESNSMAQTQLLLAEALNNEAFGHLVAIITVPEMAGNTQRNRHRNDIHAHWIQATNLGINVHKDSQHTLAWITDLHSGQPLDKVNLQLGNASATTDVHGVASLAPSEGADLLLAQQGADQAFLTVGSQWDQWDPSRYSLYRYPVLVFDDRGIYRPGERGHLKGIVRERTPGPKGDIHSANDITAVQWALIDSRGNELAEGTEKVDKTGNFDWVFSIPKSASLGRAMLNYALVTDDPNVEAESFYHSVQIQEFRRPEYEVTARLSEETYIAGQPLSATVQAAYYAGGPLPSAEVDWNIRFYEGRYTPPGHEDYTFGQWRPYWSHYGFHREQKWHKSLTGNTDSNGEHQLTLVPGSDFPLTSIVYPHRLVVEPSVTDVNRQRWASHGEVLVHPANAYIGLRPNSLFVAQGEAISLDLVVVDIQGQPLSNVPASVTAEHLKWENDEWKPTDEQRCQPSLTTSSSQCHFDAEHPGKYRITGHVEDSEGQRSQTQLDIWVSGPGADSPFDGPEQEEITLIPNQESYAPGDTALVQIDVPFSPAEALVTVRRQGIVSHEQFRIEEASHTLSIPVTEQSVPKLIVQVEAVGKAELPVQATGRLELPIRTESRKLQVDLALTNQRLKPGERAEVKVRVRNFIDERVNGGELTLYAVDESVLALTGYELPNPEPMFYGYVDEGIIDYRLRRHLSVLPNGAPEALVEEIAMLAESAGFGSGRLMADQGPGSGPSLRSDFSALAAFESTLALDHRGEATVRFDLPDNLTRYRVMAVVHREQAFGSGQTELEVSLPLMVRPSLPRFLNLGDTVELPVVVQNTTDNPMNVELALRASNLELADTSGRRIIVPANDRRELRFSARPVTAGTAHLQVLAKSGELQDAAELSLPILTPATTEAFAQYGSLTEGSIFHRVQTPTSVYADFGGLEISTSSTQFQSLTDAFIYLLDYPYGCSEQIASRLMSIAALGNLMDAFASESMPSAEKIQAHIEDGLARLAELQNPDGGWGFWQHNEPSLAHLSVHIAHALLRVQEAGHPVPTRMLNRARTYLAELETHLPDTLPSRLRHSTLAYGLYVQKLAGGATPEAAKELFEQAETEDLSLETLGWLLLALEGATDKEPMRTEITRRFNNSARESAATAQFVDDYPHDGHRILHGPRRTDAVVLAALLHHQPEHYLVEKLARGLLNNRYQGHWGSTQENVFVLQALKTYFEQRETAEPEFTARVWLNELFLGQHTYEGRTTQRNAIDLPMRRVIQEPGQSTLALEHQGSGRLYYRLGLRYAPDDLQLEASAHGFSVERQYEAINDPKDVHQHEDGSWEIRAGAAVRVKLTMTVPARRHYVALSDFMPAGLEPLNQDLKTTARLDDPEADRANIRPYDPSWYDHQQMRDERVEAFAMELAPGVYEYDYLALATTPGEFIAPPAKAEEMYQPETYGRSSTLRVRILEP